jgi:DNA-binding response OmpR family regulator/metal-dependent hydrolase (beta-lactamase superfamily II)
MPQPDILIVDDDPMVGELSCELLTDAGYKVLLVQDSLEAVDAIKANMPRLIITDIMMPGITGMDICKSVKSNPALKHIKIIVVSGKSYQVEQQRALNFGADHFLAKPYNVETFSRTIKSIMDGTAPAQEVPAPAAATPPPSAAPEEIGARTASDLAQNQLRVTFWGARGFPKTLPNSASRHGRQTACASVETSSNLFIFDAGTGIIPLGAEVMAKKKHYKDIWIFLSHFHLGHVIGLNAFQPAFDPEFSIHIIGANDPEKSLKEVTQAAFYSSFTMAKQPPKAKINIYEALADNYEILPGVKLSGMYANHQTSTMVYGLELFGKKIIYSPDSEIWGDATAFQDYDERLAIFAKNADLLIHDCMYSDADYEVHKNEGHSGLSIVVDFSGEKAQVKDLVLAHLNPGYTDEELDGLLSAAQTRIKEKGYALNCHLASEAKSFLL